MDIKKLAVCLLILSASLSILCIPSTFAATAGHWITSYTVEDATTGQKLIQADFATSDQPTVISPVISGEQLKVTFTVDIFTSGTGSLKLGTSMQKPSGAIWELVPGGDYDLGAGFTPNSQSFSFNWKEGTFEMICYGKANTVTKSINLNLVTLSAVGSTSFLDSINATVLSAGADEFQNLLDQKESTLQGYIDSGVDAGYTTLYGNMLNQSKALVNSGDVDGAIALLNAIPSSGAPMGSALTIILLPLVGVVAALAAVFAVMFMRAKGKTSYYRLVVEDQIKDLEGLTLRAQKIDRTMASNLDSVKDRLKRLVGM